MYHLDLKLRNKVIKIQLKASKITSYFLLHSIVNFKISNLKKIMVALKA